MESDSRLLKGIFELKRSASVVLSIVATAGWIGGAVQFARMEPEGEISSYLAMVLLASPLVSQGFVLLFLASRPSINGKEKDGLLNVLSLFILALYFLGMFLSASHRLTFALALHDKQQEAQEHRFGLCENPTPLVRQAQPVESDGIETNSILFFPGLADIDVDVKEALAHPVPTDPQLANRAQANKESVDSIKRKILEIDPGLRLRITLVGHTGRSEFLDQKRTNYELAAARANSVLLYLSKELRQEASLRRRVISE